MNKEEIIRKYGEAAYKKMLQQSQDWQAKHREEAKAKSAKWRANNPDKVIVNNAKLRVWSKSNPDKVLVNNHETSRKGGKHYVKSLKYKQIGLQGKRVRIRAKHRRQYLPYKQIIAPTSQLHHQWVPGTSDFRGLALVEADQHQHGYIDVIQILEGEITLLTEAEIRGK